MSMDIEAKILCKQLNSCMVSLPSSFIYPILNTINLLVQQVIIHISDPKTRKHIASVGWNGNVTQDVETIEIDVDYARILKITEGSFVHIEIDMGVFKQTLNGSSSVAETIEIEPLTTSDWELTEIHAQAIEMNFLSQVRCVRREQLLLIRANPTASGYSPSEAVLFKVVKIKMKGREVDFSIIGNDSELHIIPKPYIVEKASNTSDSPPVGKRMPAPARGKPAKYSSIIRRSIVYNAGSGITIYSRGSALVPFKDEEFLQVSVIEGPGTPQRARKTTTKELEMGLTSNSFGRPIIAKCIRLDNEDEEEEGELCCTHNLSVLLSPLLAVALGLENTTGEMVLLEPYIKKITRLDIDKCTFFVSKFSTTSDHIPSTSSNTKVINKSKVNELKRELGETLEQVLSITYGPGAPLTNGIKLPIIENILPEGGVLYIAQHNTKSRLNEQHYNARNWTITENTVPNTLGQSKFSAKFKLKVIDDTLIPSSRIQQKHEEVSYIIHGQDDKLSRLREVLYNFVPTFLCGKSGSGKTLVCRILQQDFIGNGYFAKYIDFDHVTGYLNDEQAIEDSGSLEEEDATNRENKENNQNKLIVKLFDKILKQASWHSPSLLILDNLDKILPKEVEHGDNGASSQLSEILINKFEKYKGGTTVNILITAKSRDSINSVLFQNHLVDEEMILEAPNKYQVSEILKGMMVRRFPNHVGPKILKRISDIASELEGYLPLDLENLLDRAFHNMISKDQIVFEYENFLCAIEGYTPNSLRGVKLQKSATNWSDIGGLKEVKRILLETLEWPTKYAPIFEKCSLRLRSGILLYGYPGCGKTMLASAIASQCGLNFISVKGPEVLNKYIGASEQSIRDLFERAQSAKPCILFFDEFDSIAPKRGHDSTGVTDRIVNQLLTQMDGAEGLEGVYVLAATSRPDLIDSALLRPGRLDKSVICDLPDFENRLDILNTIVKTNGFHLQQGESALDEIAKHTDGYTGADLQAVVYNAYLKSVHEVLEAKDSDIGESNLAGDDLSEVLSKTFTPRNQKFKYNGELEKKIKTVICRSMATDDDIDNESTQGANRSIEKREIICIKIGHLKESLEETKKSISTNELKKLNRIYSQFESSKRPSEMKSGEGSTEVGVRTSLM